MSAKHGPRELIPHVYYQIVKKYSTDCYRKEFPYLSYALGMVCYVDEDSEPEVPKPIEVILDEFDDMCIDEDLSSPVSKPERRKRLANEMIRSLELFETDLELNCFYAAFGIPSVQINVYERFTTFKAFVEYMIEYLLVCT